MHGESPVFSATAVALESCLPKIDFTTDFFIVYCKVLYLQPVLPNYGSYIFVDFFSLKGYG
jgi:hypothetical protein